MNTIKQLQKCALEAYERLIKTLTAEQIIMLEEALDKMFELDEEIKENG